MKRISCIVLSIIMAMTVFADIPISYVSAADTNNETSSQQEQQEEQTNQTQQETIDISTAAVTLNCYEFTYTGEQITPDSIEVKLNDAVLTEGVDYTVAYENNVEPGTATAVITGTGTYTGQISVQYTIIAVAEPISLNDAEIKLSGTNFVYNGKEKKPYPIITYGDSKLVRNVDFEVVGYEDNTMPGTGKVTIAGIGNYKDTVVKEFDIALVEGFKAAKKGTEYIKFSWKKESNVTGYKIYKYNFSKEKWLCTKTVKGAANTSATIKGLTPGFGGKYKIRTYLTKGGKTYYGPWSDVRSEATKPSKGYIKSFKCSKALVGTVKWAKKNGTGYEVLLSRYSNFKNPTKYKITSSKTLSKSIKNLKDGKTYYVKVRAYKKYYGKTTYGAWSAKKKVVADGTGWSTISGKKYYYRDGERLKGTHTIAGNKYYFSKDRNGELLGASYKMYKETKNRTSGTKWMIAVSRELNRACVYKRENGRWVLKDYMKCTTGAKGTRTPAGSFKVPKKKSKLNFFGLTEDYTCWYATRITGRVYFHSVLYDKFSKTSVQDGRLGYNLSHGCIRLAISDAKWIHKNIKSGTRVVIY